MTLPLYLLDHVFSHLAFPDLIHARLVCAGWNAVILSRQALRRKLFLQPPTAPILESLHRQPVILHPVFHCLESDWAHAKTPISVLGCGDLRDSPVGTNFATEPALTRFVVLLPMYSVTVERAGGVTVWDAAMAVKRLFVAVAKEMEPLFDGGWPGMLDGFRQTNRSRKETANIKFFARFRHELDENKGLDEHGSIIPEDGC